MNKVYTLKRHQQGLTLLEVLIAVTILALIGTISYRALDTTLKSKEVVEEHLEELAKLDRVWALLESDFRHVINHGVVQAYGAGSGSALPAFVLENANEDYWLVALRGGHANPLNFPRSEMIRVGYRVQENVLWRDVWFNLSSVDVDEAQQRKVLEGVDSVEIRALPHNATSISPGAWVDRWPPAGNAVDFPLAVEVNLKLQKNEVEIKRLFSLVKGA